MKPKTTGQYENAGSACHISSIPLTVRFLLVILSAAIVLPTPLTQAQNFQVLHAFTGGGDDASPGVGLIVDAAGNFYGSTSGVGNGTNGAVFKLTSRGSGWLLNPLKNFGRSGNGPSEPYSKLTIGPDGVLYGTTVSGGSANEGTVFKLQPPSHACASFSCPWTLTVLHEFQGSDGAEPYGEVVFDRAGNMYGTTFLGGATYCTWNRNGGGCGLVYELSPSGSGWTETVIYDFNVSNGYNGAWPSGGLIFDADGNLYGLTFELGPENGGVVYELSPSQGGGWTQAILYGFGFSNDGYAPLGTLIMDAFGNLYGTTQGGGSANGGTVFEVSQQGYQILYNFPDGSNPAGTPVFDSSGNLYGATMRGGFYGYGTVFKLTPSQGSWIESDLHVFQASDGIYPNDGIALDSAGNLFGTAERGGYFPDVCTQGCGTVWKITP